jgi:hypothetical protein
MDGTRSFFQRRFAKIIEINRKFARPHVKMTPAVKIALLLLRLYLIALVGILFYKFLTLVVK